jgi:hypothetical protein
VEKKYLPLVQDIIASQVSNVLEIVPFDVAIRRASAAGRHQKPVRKVHIDQSERGAYLRAKHELRDRPELLSDIMTSRVRYRIINVWKPIHGLVGDHPLVLADSQTVSDADLVAVEQKYPHYVGETLAVKFNPVQKYWYWSGMDIHEAILLQIYDSGHADTGEGGLSGAACAHASFNLSGTGDESLFRESV